MHDTEPAVARGWRRIERYAYVERSYDEVWTWLAGHLSTLGDPLPGGNRSVELRLRPGGREVSRSVVLHVGGMVCGQGRARAALRWADATHSHLFPQFEATLDIVPVPSDAAPFTQLGILGRYRPPLGPLGAIGDRLLGEDVIQATVTVFLEELAAAVADHLVPPSLSPQPDRCAGPPPPGDGQEILRVLLVVDGLAVRPGGAARVCESLSAIPGIVHVTVNPFSGLASVGHDPAVRGAGEVMAALEGR
jgi:hypothetical protein